MKLIESRMDIWGECPNINDTDAFLKWMERAGRACWNSEDKICEGSAKPFLEKIIDSGHTSVLETSNICIESFSKYPYKNFESEYNKERRSYYNTGNLRAFKEYLELGVKTNYTLDKVINILISVAIPNEEVPRDLKRVTVEFTTNRAMTHEIVRHRVMSFLQVSQRYVDPTRNDKKSIDFIKPVWYDSSNENVQLCFDNHCRRVEEEYIYLRNANKSPQQAREILPNATATRIIVTGFLKDWDKFFNLRTAAGADPTMRLLAGQCKDEFVKLGFI